MVSNEILFIPCQWKEIHALVEKDIRTNNVTIESFWEEHVLESTHYKMMFQNEIVGYFAVHKGKTLVLFHVSDTFANQSQKLFAEVKKYENVTNAMVPTGNEFFLSHCIDNFSRIEKQAYFSIYTEKEISPEQQKPLKLRLADVNKDYDALKLSGDFLDGEIEKLHKGNDYLNIYIAEYNGNIVGFGVIEYGRVLSDIASIGMYVCDQYRRQGIGANILQQLKHICQENGCRAFSGCWYYNHNSKKSMESAGAYSKTRLIRFYF